MLIAAASENTFNTKSMHVTQHSPSDINNITVYQQINKKM